MPLPELKRRADFMYSGATGAAVASGAEGVTTAPTYGLVQDVISVVKALPSALFETTRRRSTVPAGCSTSTMRWACSSAT